MPDEKVQISPRQLSLLAITMVISTVDLFLPSFVAQEAGKDSWMSAIFAVVAMFLILWINLALSRRYEGVPWLDIYERIMGKPIGFVIGLLYVFYFFYVTWFVVSELSFVLITAFLPMTPAWVFIATSVAISAYAVGRGLEVIARINELVLPLGIGTLGFLILVNVKEMDFSLFLPLLEDGMVPPLLGGLVILSWLCEMMIILQLAHFISKPAELGKSLTNALLVIGAAILGGTLIYALFGPLTEIMLLPALEFARFASIGRFIQNFDLLVMAIWIIGIYVKIIICFYIGTFVLGRVTGVKNHKALVLPVGLFLGIMAAANEVRMVDTVYVLHYIFPFYSLIMSFLIPGVFLVVSLLKKNNREKRRKREGSGRSRGTGDKNQRGKTTETSGG